VLDYSNVLMYAVLFRNEFQKKVRGPVLLGEVLCGVR